MITTRGIDFGSGNSVYILFQRRCSIKIWIWLTKLILK